MKTFLKNIALLTSVVFIIGCSDNERFVDEVFDATTRGTVMKTISQDLNFQVGQESILSVSAEVIDQRGQDFESIDVFLRYTDNREDDDPNNVSRDEELFTTFAKSDLDLSGEYPVINFSFTSTEFNDFFNLEEEQYDQGGRIRIRFALVMSDGRVFSSDNLNNVVSGGAFYRSPFEYSFNMICLPDVPQPGTWTVDLQDSFGDGWNGAEVVVTIDGVETTIGLPSGSSGSESFEVPVGSEVLSIKYSSGEYDGEVTFQVTAPSGDEILDAGPSPAVDQELVDYCSLNYRIQSQ
jgi:hypothetical protein